MTIKVPNKYLEMLLRKMKYSSEQSGFSKKTKKRLSSAINQLEKLLSGNGKLSQIKMTKNKLQTLGILSNKSPQ
jgi:hypothetical protein